MLVRSSKFALHMLAASLIGLILMSGFIVWQLSRGPISVGFLTPYVQNALNADQYPVRVRLADTVLAWAGLDRTLDVRAVGLEVVDKDGIVLASVPEISVRFSARALLSGLVAPTSLELLGPRVRIVRNAEGLLAYNFAQDGPATSTSDVDIVALVDQLIARPDKTRETGYLRRLSVLSALVEYEDQQSGMTVTAPRVNLALERDAQGIRAAGSVALDMAGKQARFQVSGILNARSGNSELGLTFTDLLPGTLAPLLPGFEFPEGIDIPLNGTVALSLDSGFSLVDVGFDIDSKGGEVSVPSLYSKPQRVADIVLRGRARDGFRSFAIDEGSFAVADSQVSFSGTLVRRGQRLFTDFDAGVRNLAVNRIEELWPEAVGRDARLWIVENLRDGEVKTARVNVSATAPVDDPGELEVIDIDGRIDATGVSVHFLRPMDPVKGVNAVGTFDMAGFVIDATAGNLRQMEIESGRITISGLDGSFDVERISIDLMIAGAVRGAFEMLEQEPLGFISRVDIDPADASGAHRTQLIVQFPLLADLEFDAVQIAAASSMSGFALKKGPFGLPVSNGELSVQVDSEKLIADGNLAVSGVPAGIAWTEWFADEIPTRRTYQVRAILNDNARRKLGFDTAPWVTGPVGMGLSYSESAAGYVSGAAELDLSSAAMAIEALGWSKTAGIPGRAFLRFSGEGENIRRLDRFSVSAADLVAEGELGLRPKAGGGVVPAQLTLGRLAFGGTDIVAAAEFAENGAIDVSIGGRQLDLRREVAAFGEGGSADKEDDADPTPLRVHISREAPIEIVRLGEETVLNNLWGSAQSEGSDVREAQLAANLNGKGEVTLDIVDRGDARDLRLVTANGGDLVSALDIADTILGGRLEIKGAIADDVEPLLFAGQVALTDFHMTEASSITRALTLASFEGIKEAVGGRGLAFRRAEVSMTFSRDEIVISDAKLRGSGLGVLAAGRIDRRTDRIELEGELAPAYTLNSLLGNIPLIGKILTGGGDGIFAASYKVDGPIDNPKVSVNPLSVLTPGIIRRLLTGFGSDNNEVDSSLPGNDPSEPGVGQAPAQ